MADPVATVDGCAYERDSLAALSAGCSTITNNNNSNNNNNNSNNTNIDSLPIQQQ